jgi:hypothetical protein
MSALVRTARLEGEKAGTGQGETTHAAVVRQKVTVAGFAQRIALTLEVVYQQGLARQRVQSVAKGFANLEGGRVLA